MQTAKLAKAFELTLPDWVEAALAPMPERFTTVEARMELAIALAHWNFEHDTGGPFGAAVFEEDTGVLVSIGVNRVVPGRCSSAHAETMALSLAQVALGSHDLGGPGRPAHQLVVNWRPCAMCYGAVCWSGVRSLVIAGSGPELEALTGFDEGPIHPAWEEELERRGIRLQDGVLTDRACEVFRAFGQSGRLVYNGRAG